MMTRHVVAEYVGGPEDGRRVPQDADAPLPDALLVWAGTKFFDAGATECGFVYPSGGARAVWHRYVLEARVLDDSGKEIVGATYLYRGREIDRIGGAPIAAKV